MSILVLSVLLFSYAALPLPIAPEQQQPAPPAQYISWHSQPNERGSFGLILNCVITLSLCVWTAVHLNVPAPRPQRPASRFARFRCSYFFTRFQWMLLGLLAPELAVYAAWRQWSSARILARKMNEILLKETKEYKAGSDQPPQKWKIIHGFYACMGGFVMDTCNLKDGEYIPGSPRLTLTATGVLFLAENGFRLPYLTAESIRDRSKADGLAKSLVCLQAGYMIVQCSGRLAAGLPISLLEINTLGHVICALIMYLFWLKKPQDIHEPTAVRFDGMDSLCAYTWMCSSMSTTSRGETSEIRELSFYPDMEGSETSEGASHAMYTDDTQGIFTTTFGRDDQIEDQESSTLLSTSAPTSMAVQVPFRQRDHRPREHRFNQLPSTKSPLKSTATIGENEVLLGSQIGPANAEEVSSSNKLMRKSYSRRLVATKRATLWEPAKIGLDETDIRRWRLASAFLKSHSPNGKISQGDNDDNGAVGKVEGNGNNQNQKPKSTTPIVFRNRYEHRLVVNAVPNWGDEAGLLSSFQELPWIIISITTGLYGGLHATAWYSHFPSSAERILWCASCIIVAASGILTGLLITVDRLPRRLGWRPTQSTRHEDSAIRYYFSDHDMGYWDILFSMVVVAVGMSFALPAALAVVLYAPARMFLLIEAFISLRNAPVETYITPDWTEWIPHL